MLKSNEVVAQNAIPEFLCSRDGRFEKWEK